jgi:hypothetical protein
MFDCRGIRVGVVGESLSKSLPRREYSPGPKSALEALHPAGPQKLPVSKKLEVIAVAR